MIQSYEIHDNGGRPFKVTIKEDSKVLQILKPTKSNDVLVKSVDNYQHVFVGEDPTEPDFKGNTILIQLSARSYIFVGWKVFSFDTVDEIYDYKSKVGNSDVPYPVAMGKENVYLLSEEVFFPVSQFDDSDSEEDAYDQYYNFNAKQKQKVSKIQTRIIHDRLWHPINETLQSL